MKSKLIIAILCMVLINGVSIFADESKAVEAGNKICPVSGDRIDENKMGKPVKYEYNGKIYTLCCNMCVKDFKKDPQKYSKIAEEEVKKANEQK